MSTRPLEELGSLRPPQKSSFIFLSLNGLAQAGPGANNHSHTQSQHRAGRSRREETGNTCFYKDWENSNQTDCNCDGNRDPRHELLTRCPVPVVFNYVKREGAAVPGHCQLLTRAWYLPLSGLSWEASTHHLTIMTQHQHIVTLHSQMSLKSWFSWFCCLGADSGALGTSVTSCVRLSDKLGQHCDNHSWGAWKRNWDIIEWAEKRFRLHFRATSLINKSIFCNLVHADMRFILPWKCKWKKNITNRSLDLFGFCWRVSEEDNDCS